MLRNPSYQRDGLVAHRGHRAALTAVAFRPDGKQFVTGDVTGALKVWNAEVHPEAITLPSQPAATRVAFGKDGRYVAVAGRSHSWEIRRGAIPTSGFQNQALPPDPARSTRGAPRAATRSATAAAGTTGWGCTAGSSSLRHSIRTQLPCRSGSDRYELHAPSLLRGIRAKVTVDALSLAPRLARGGCVWPIVRASGSPGRSGRRRRPR